MGKRAFLGDYRECPNCGGLVSRGDSDDYGFCHGGHEICGIYLRIPSRFSSDKITIIKRLDENGRMVPITWQHFNEMGLAVKKFFEAGSSKYPETTTTSL